MSSNPTLTGQDEARRALATQIEASVFAFRLQGDNHMRIAMSFASWQQVIAALRAPSLDRGAEEMRTAAVKCCEAIADDSFRKSWATRAATATFCAQQIRALPVPADLNEGGGK